MVVKSNSFQRRNRGKMATIKKIPEEDTK